MATVTGTNLLAGILATQGVTLSPVLQAALAARLQAAIDSGNDSNIQIAAVLGSNAQLLGTVPAGQAPTSFLSGLVGTTKTEIETGTPAATYALTAGAASADEGTTATFELATTNVAAGTEVAYTISGIDAADLASGALTGKAVVGADGKATISVALADDKATEGAETLTVTLDGKAVSANTTVNDTSKGLTFTLAATKAEINEGEANTFTVTASEAVAVDTEVTFQLALGTAQLADFNAGAFNAQKVVIKAGETTATHSITAITNDGTELTETYKVTASVAGQQVGSVDVSILDGAVGAGQTFTLTTGLDFIPGMKGSNDNTVTAGNDLIIGVDAAVGATLTGVDQIDGGQGVDTLKVLTSVVTAAPLAGVSNVEIIEVQGSAAVLVNTSAVAGVTNLNVTKAAGAVDATAAATTDVGVSVKGIAGNTVVVNGGKDVNVTTTEAVATIDVGATGTDPVGAVTISATGAAAANANTPVNLGNISVGGGNTISVTQKATSDASALVAGAGAVTHNQGDVTVVAAATTTGVTIKQDADVAAASGAVAVAGVVPVATVKFGAMALNDTIVIGGLTFTASKALTAAEAATAFANLSKDFAPLAGDTQGSGIVANGVYTGAFTGWTTGAASGDTVLFTSTAASSAYAAVAAPTNTGTAAAVVSSVLTTTGVNAVTGVAAKLGVTAGVVDITGGAALKTVTVDGYDVTAAAGTNNIKGAGNTVLDTINLSNGGGVTIASAAATLALNLEKVGGAIAFTAAPTTLNIKSIGNNTIGTLTAAATEALNVSGTGTLSAVTASDLTATKAIKVTESAGLNLTSATLTNLTSVDTTGTTGAVTVTIDSTKTTYAGGAGVDTVTFSNTTAAAKALDLGAGNDTLVFAAGSKVAVPTVVLKGGAGDDTVSLLADDAVAFSGNTAFAAQLDSFERLAVTGATGVQAIDLGKLGFTNHVTVAGVGGAGTLTLTDLANNGTVVLTADVANGVTAAIKDAATGAADVLNVAFNKSGNLAAGTLTAANVETVNINGGTSRNADTLVLTADKATTVNVFGSTDLTLTLTGSTKVTLIDASTVTTGSLTVTSLNTTAATTIKGGAGNDVLTAATGTTADVLVGGAGNDILVANAGLSTLTGGAGNDVFRVATPSLNVNTYATVTDFAAGDLLQITGAASFAAAKVTLGDTAVFQDYANAAINSLGLAAAGWFQFGGNTYVVADLTNNSTTFVNSEDLIVKLTGLVDLSNASFNNDSDTIALV